MLNCLRPQEKKLLVFIGRTWLKCSHANPFLFNIPNSRRLYDPLSPIFLAYAFRLHRRLDIPFRRVHNYLLTNVF